MSGPVDPQQFLNVIRPCLEASDASQLAAAVTLMWAPADIGGLLGDGRVDVRRSAAVVLGLVGTRKEVYCLARALNDADDGVAQMAENSLWSVWFRLGSPATARPLKEGLAMMGVEAYGDAVQRFRQATYIDPTFAEAHNQCGIAHFLLGQYVEALDSCKRAVALIPCHFGALAGMGHCHAEMGDLPGALRYYRVAVKIHPRLKAIRAAVTRLEERLGDQRDSSGMYNAEQIRV